MENKEKAESESSTSEEESEEEIEEEDSSTSSFESKSIIYVSGKPDSRSKQSKSSKP
jgi:hypothetical protein